jgi:iron complex transport system ATP-binding protein
MEAMNAVSSNETARTRLAASDLTVAIAGRTLVRSLDFAAPAGAVTCVLGRNGAGKTLTMHTLAGLRAPAEGQVVLDGRALSEWPARALARCIGLLAQTTEDPFPSTVLETVLIGRHPHIGFWQWESEDDRRLASSALSSVGMQDLAGRDVATLSGGERRRVAIATLLAQDPDVYLLDEPINHLDPHHQLDVLGLMRSRAQAGRAVVMSLHDAGLAARFADQALLLFGDGEWLAGPTADVLTEETMTRLYGVTLQEIRWPGGRTFVAVDRPKPL